MAELDDEIDESRVKQIMAQIGYVEPPSPQPDEAGIKRLAAYYVSEKPLTVAELREHLAKELPDYMLPTYFIRLDKLPLTSNGKVDRRALPAFSHETIQPASDFMPPRTETEKALAAIWSELLNVQHIGVDDDFFDLGGQSLVAIKAVSRIRDVFGVDVALRNLFERPTVAGLAEVIDGLSWVTQAKTPASPGSAQDREEITL
jgi:acyl carrier protein